VQNLPGLASISYRVGRWASFKESMLARLSSNDYPALAPLKTREDDDFSIALLDASAVVLDILTFYQERLANESYLRTATQLASLTQLSRLIGYRPSPGVSASTYLAFTVKAATGAPTDLTTQAITIPAGVKTQSVPAQGQSPQTFETSAPILAKPDWNALPVQTGVPWSPQTGNTNVYLAGTATQLNPGDAILIVGDEVAAARTAGRDSEQWDVRIVTSVQADPTRGRTLVTWSEGLGYGSSPPASQNPVFYALRQRAALFGYNAVNPMLLSVDTISALKTAGELTCIEDVIVFGVDICVCIDWAFAQSGSNILDLDAVYSKLTPSPAVGPRNWLALITPDGATSRSPSGLVSLLELKAVTTTVRSDYGASAKISRITTDVDPSTTYFSQTRSSSVLAQSEALSVAEQPLDHPLYGAFVDLAGVRSDLAGVTAIAISGKRQKLMVAPGLTATFTPDDGTDQVTLNPGDLVSIVRPPDFLNPNGTIPSWRSAQQAPTLLVADANNRTGTIVAPLATFVLASAAASDPVVQEFALVGSLSTIVTSGVARTRIALQNALLNCYDRPTTSVNANVGPGTAGASVTELLGSGAAATPNQKFTLKQTPLTYVQAPTATGAQSTLQVRVNGVAWTEEPSLYGAAPTAKVFSTINLTGGGAVVQGGDGVEGATFPTGQNNIVANYRIGIGAAGNVGAGTITTLVDRPLGVSGVTNPLAATGGQDAQSASDVRANAPLSVLTLGRAVSITDYQNIAASFAGIAKASAIWIPGGAYRGVFLTVAGAGGAALPPGNPTLANLLSALQAVGNPTIAVYAQSFIETTFSIKTDLAYDPAYDQMAVAAQALELLQQTYSFAARSFGQGVSGDEIEALLQGVPGVLAVNVRALCLCLTSKAGDLGPAGYSVSAYNAWRAAHVPTPPRPSSGLPFTICPFTPVVVPNVLPSPGEILVLDPDPKKVILGAMA
jgi:hypothetical protein